MILEFPEDNENNAYPTQRSANSINPLPLNKINNEQMKSTASLGRIGITALDETVKEQTSRRSSISAVPNLDSARQPKAQRHHKNYKSKGDIVKEFR